MIYITQLIYINAGQEAVFNEFENIAIPTIAKYNGQLLLRIRPAKDSYIQLDIDAPYEVHLIQFATDNDFKNFTQDETRKKFLHLKNQSIKLAVLIKGEKMQS